MARRGNLYRIESCELPRDVKHVCISLGAVIKKWLIPYTKIPLEYPNNITRIIYQLQIYSMIILHIYVYFYLYHSKLKILNKSTLLHLINILFRSALRSKIFPTKWKLKMSQKSIFNVLRSNVFNVFAEDTSYTNRII